MFGALAGRYVFWRDLAATLKAGLRVEDALSHLSAGRGYPARLARELLASGRPSLAERMAALPGRFSPAEAAAVSAGEAAGKLPEVLGALADLAKSRRDRIATLLARLAYPVFVIHAAAAAGTVAPALASGRPLGAWVILKMLLVLLPFYFVTALLFVVPGLLRRFSRTAALVVDGLILKAPFLGAIARRRAESEFCYLMGTLLGAGIPLREALNQVVPRLGNLAFAATLKPACSVIESGGSLREAFEGLLSPIQVARLSTAEVDGDVARAFTELAEQARAQEDEAARGGNAALFAFYFALAVLYVVWAVGGFWSTFLSLRRF